MKRMKSMWLRLFVTGLWFSVGLSALAQCTGDCDPDAQEQCEKRDGWYWLGPPDCRCQTADSPIIIDLNGKGIRLTDALHGVLFDLENTGKPIRVAWTVPGASNAFTHSVVFVYRISEDLIECPKRLTIICFCLLTGVLRVEKVHFCRR